MARSTEKYTQEFFLALFNSLQTTNEKHAQVKEAIESVEENSLAALTLKDMLEPARENMEKAQRKISIAISNVILGEIDNVSLTPDDLLAIAKIVSKNVPLK